MISKSLLYSYLIWFDHLLSHHVTLHHIIKWQTTFTTTCTWKRAKSWQKPLTKSTWSRLITRYVNSWLRTDRQTLCTIIELRWHFAVRDDAKLSLLCCFYRLFNCVSLQGNIIIDCLVLSYFFWWLIK